MRVVFVTPGITEAGIGVHVRELANALSKKGIETRIYTAGSIESGNLCIPSNHGGRVAYGNVEIYEFYGFNPPEFGGLLPKMFNPIPHPDLFRNLLKEKDIVHIHGNEYFITVIAALMAKLKKNPYVLTIHNVGKAFSDDSSIRVSRRILNSTMFRMAIRHADAVIAPTDEAADYLKRFQPKRVENIRLAIDLRRFEGYSDSPGQYILYLGRLDPVKEVSLLIESAPLILEKYSVDFVVAGDGAERSRLESLVKEKGLSEKFRFLGRVAYHDVPKVLLGAAVFYGGRAGGYTLLESAAARRPIVCIEDKWSIYTLGGKRNALFIPKDKKSLAEAIVSILENPSLSISLSENAFKFVKEHASWDSTIDNYIKLYESLIR